MKFKIGDKVIYEGANLTRYATCGKMYVVSRVGNNEYDGDWICFKGDDKYDAFIYARKFRLATSTDIKIAENEEEMKLAI